MADVVVERFQSSPRSPCASRSSTIFLRAAAGPAPAYATAFGGDLRVFSNDADLGEIVALAHIEVGRVVSRSDFHGTGSEFWIDGSVFDERDLAVHQRQDSELCL